MERWIPDTLRLPEGILDMVLDTDTYNEVDDQFALCYALLSPERVNVQAIYASPFHNERSSGAGDGMEKSYAEITRLLGVMGRSAEGFAFRGSDRFLRSDEEYVDSPAARDLIARAMARPAGSAPLFVVAIGAITNVASALAMQPEIADRIHIVWLGGQPLTAPSAKEFNLSGDIHASRALFSGNAPLTLVPCAGVASHLLATVPELERWLGGKNALCDALIKLFSEFTDDHFGWAKEIWDVSAVARLIHPEWATVLCEPRPRLSMEGDWCRDPRRAPILVVDHLNRNAIFRDMFRKLADFTPERIPAER